MPESIEQSFDKASEIIRHHDTVPTVHREECYITFKVNNDIQFASIKKQLKAEMTSIFRLKRCKDFCTINFIL